MNKKTFLANLETFLKNIVFNKLYTYVSAATRQLLEEDIKEFIKQGAAEYTLQELKETFTSGQVTLGLFLEYRDTKIFTSDTTKAKSGSRPAAKYPDKKRKNAIESMDSRPRDWYEPVTGMHFVNVPGGCFPMGCALGDDDALADEKPIHDVCLDEFWIGKFAVTVAQYMKFVKETGSHYPHWLEQGSPYNITNGNDDYYTKLGKALIGATYPIVGVSWDDANAFAKWLSAKSGNTFTLPTEAEWEYAARSGGKLEKYPGGYAVDQVAWYYKNSGGTPHPVGTKLPNGLGIHNMSGNVSEWCLDLYSRFAYSRHPRRNPVNLNDGSCRVVRGGCWNYGSRDVRCTDRSIFVPDVRTNDLGFRLVKKP